MSILYKMSNFVDQFILEVGIEGHKDMSMQYIPPYTPLLYSNTVVCRGIPIFLIFASKHRLWVLVRTASPSFYERLTCILSKRHHAVSVKVVFAHNFSLKLVRTFVLPLAIS